MSQRSVHTTSNYSTYNQSSNVQSSRNSTYAPVTNHYNEPHIAKSVSPADVNPDDIDLNHPANWGIFDDPSQPPRWPKWERKLSTATQSYPVKNYDSSRQTIPTVSDAGLSTPHSSYQATFDGHASSLYSGAPLQSSPPGPLPLPQESYTYTAHGAPFMAGSTVHASTQSQNQGFSGPYVGGTHTYTPRSAASTSVPPQRISRHVTPSSTPAPVQSRPPIPSEWHQSSSQMAPAEPRDKEQRKSRKPARHSRLDGIPRDQMQRFRIVDFGAAPSSSSGSKRTRSPGSDALPDAKVRATVQGGANGGPKDKDKAELSLEEQKLLEKRKKEANRVKIYRNTVDGAYDELRVALYPDEETHASVRSDHGKRKCMLDAAEWIRTSTPNDVCQQKEATLYARIRELEAGQGFAMGNLPWVGHEQCHREIASLRKTMAVLHSRLGENGKQN